MQRIRTVKPQLFKHGDLYDAEIETGLPLRIAFVALFTCCDREGRFKWKPRELKLDCLPYDDLDFSRVLDALTTRGFVVKYASGGRQYGAITTFLSHQNINNRESESEIPSPQSPDSEILTNQPDVVPHTTRQPRVSHASTTPLVQVQGEGKGREGKAISRVDDAAVVFDYWKTKLGKNGNSKFTPERRKRVIDRLKDGYSVDDIKLGIDGCASSPHHMGENETHTIYDDLELICRNGTKLEGFIGKNDSPNENNKSEPCAL